MAPEKTPTLAAVLSVDVADFKEWREADSDSAGRGLARTQESFDKLADEFHGSGAGGTDGVMRAVFPGVADAVRASVALHEATDDANEGLDEEDQVDIRAGVAIGLVTGMPEDLSGEGVDAADTLRAAARPGEVRITGAVYEQVRSPFGKSFRRARTARIAGHDLATYAYAPDGAADEAEAAPPDKSPEERARATVQQIKHLYRNMLLGGATIVFLLLLNVAASADFWFQWPALFIVAVLGLQALRSIGPEGIGESLRRGRSWLRHGSEWGQNSERILRERLSGEGLSERGIRRRVSAMRNFRRRVGSFAGIVAFLFVINLLSSPGSWWVIWPALGFAFALAINAICVFGVDGILGTGWEEKKRDELRMKYERES